MFRDSVKGMKEIANTLFGAVSESKKTAEAVKAFSEGLESGLRVNAPVIDELSEKTTNTSEEKCTDAHDEEWVWVTGYKGMNENMQCLGGFQYELSKRYDMPENEEIEVCERGFHMCLKLEDVFNYVSLGGGNRFFEVRALVRKKDVDEYGTEKRNTYYGLILSQSKVNKLASKSIEIVRELSVDEIMEHVPETLEWSDEYKKMAITVGIEGVRNLVKIDKLTGLGYSHTFATWLVNSGKYGIAKAVGSQEGLSMDMKVFCIMNDNSNNSTITIK